MTSGNPKGCTWLPKVPDSNSIKSAFRVSQSNRFHKPSPTPKPNREMRCGNGVIRNRWPTRCVSCQELLQHRVHHLQNSVNIPRKSFAIGWEMCKCKACCQNHREHNTQAEQLSRILGWWERRRRQEYEYGCRGKGRPPSGGHVQFGRRVFCTRMCQIIRSEAHAQ